VSTSKQEIIRMIEQMPEQAQVDDIMTELYFYQKVDSGLQELDEGRGIPHAQVKGRLNKWLS